jgi:phage terminase large subunit-like protein
MNKIIIGVDPAVTSGKNSDETGIVVVKRVDNRAIVLDDLSLKGSPMEWATRVVTAYHEYKASYIVAEINQGGDLVETLIRSIDPTLRFKGVRAISNKQSRAQPISMLYEQARVTHQRPLPKLEEQMCSYAPGGPSPDRLDALVWALTDIMGDQLFQKAEPLKIWRI